MKTKLQLLFGVALLPLLFTACYKDYEQVRIKPYRPALVVPVAEADSVTMMDMLFETSDTNYLDATTGRLEFMYQVQSPTIYALRLKKVDKLIIKDGVIANNAKLFPDLSSPTLVTLTLDAGAELSSNVDVTLPLAGGGELELKHGVLVTLQDSKEIDMVKVKDKELSCDIAFTVKAQSIKSAKLENKLPKTGSYSAPVKIGAYGKLLWYSGELTDLSMDVKLLRSGWIKNANVKYWFENTRVKKMTRKGQPIDSIVTIVGKQEGLPFNIQGDSTFTAAVEAGKDSIQANYAVGNAVDFSKDWLTEFHPGQLQIRVNDKFLNLEADSTMGGCNAYTTLRLPLAGRFNALVREFNVGEGEGRSSLPDINESLSDSGSRVRLQLTNNDTVKLHFYFANTTPFEIYAALKIGVTDADVKDVTSSAKELENMQSQDSKIGEMELKNESVKATKRKIEDFKFFKAVDANEVDDATHMSIPNAKKERVVTIAIPYSQYEEARKNTNYPAIQGLLLFKSPKDGNNGLKVVSPRITDYVKVRLGIELSPEIEIDLTNKN